MTLDVPEDPFFIDFDGIDDIVLRLYELYKDEPNGPLVAISQHADATFPDVECESDSPWDDGLGLLIRGWALGKKAGDRPIIMSSTGDGWAWFFIGTRGEVRRRLMDVLHQVRVEKGK